MNSLLEIKLIHLTPITLLSISIVAKIILERTYRPLVVHKILSRTWGLLETSSIRKVVFFPNTFRFHFENIDDKWIMEQWP